MSLGGNARARFLCDAERCIECNACVTACKNENEVPWGINRRRVVTINDGSPGERSISVACMHCSDAPCMAVCPVDCFYQTEDGIVLHSKDLCIGCGYCINVASNTFMMLSHSGRCRALRQDGDSLMLIQEAIDTCPVDCIHWVDFSELRSLLSGQSGVVTHRGTHQWAS